MYSYRKISGIKRMGIGNNKWKVKFMESYKEKMTWVSWTQVVFRIVDSDNGGVKTTEDCRD